MKKISNLLSEDRMINIIWQVLAIAKPRLSKLKMEILHSILPPQIYLKIDTLDFKLPFLFFPTLYS